MSRKEYFAYGSNLNFEQMAYRCPEATVVGTAKLDGYELAFRRGYLTILPKEGATVEGLIWSITDHDESQLDCYEGYPTFYDKETVTVTDADGTPHEIMVYTMNAPYRDQLLPVSSRYNAFDKANDIINRRKAKSEQERKIAHTSQNPTLLAGIVYCAHCGAKMSGFMHTDRYKLADGSIREKVQPKYNCFQRGQRNKGGRDCDGQALYLAERVDAIVLKIVEEVFEQIRDTPYSQVAENRIRQESNLQKTKRAAAEKKIKAAQHALERFEGEILKCLDGTSNFTEDMIAKQIRRYQQELDDAKAEYAELQNARLNEAAEIRKLRTYYDDFKGWAEEFDTAPLEMKRMILSHLIDRVEVGRKYQVIVKFNMKYRQFLECTAETYNTEIGA